MPNPIAIKQNSDINIKRLEAQRRLYSEAKRLMGAQVFLSVPVIILLSFVALMFDKGWIIESYDIKKADLAWLVGAAGVFIAFLEVVWFTPMIGHYKEQAAKIQQCFDCDVLGLHWNEILCGKSVDFELVEKWSRKYRAKGLPRTDLENWYSVALAGVPLAVTRMLCQRTNCRWDVDLRKNYNVLMYCIGAGLFLLLISVAFALDMTMKNFFAVVLAPSLPFAVFASKTIIDNKDSIGRIDSIKDAIDGIWEKTLKKKVTEREMHEFSQLVQDGIYMNRKNNPLIFDWVHFLSRNENEILMNKSAENCVDEYNKAMANP